MSRFENLVFEGGGVLGIAYAGAMQALEKHDILKDITQVAGTSAGAITAAAISAGNTAAEVNTLTRNTDFKSFEDKWNPIRILTKYGLYKGDALLSFVKKVIAKKAPANSTFRDFQEKGFKDLRVFSTDLNVKDVREFSFRKTPDVVVAEAVRASMSIPIFFSAWQFKNLDPNQYEFAHHIFVDGGTVYNYPINTFDENGKVNKKTLGFHLNDLENKGKETGLKMREPIKYVKVLFDTLLDSQNIDFERDPEQKDRTVIINDHGISATDFDLKPEQLDLLFNSGEKATDDFLQNLPTQHA